MLYTQTVEPATLELLNQLQNIEEINNFYLVGGTNLSLRYGHRMSVDIDLFTNVDFDLENLDFYTMSLIISQLVTNAVKLYYVK